MGWACIPKMDADDLFAYHTNKIVQVRDRRLGFLYTGFLVAIVLYIVFYNLLWEKKYLALDAPAGTFRFSLRKPPSFTPLEELPYCLQNAPSYNGFPNYECKFYGEELVVYPKTEQSALLGSTRITQEGMRADCDFSQPDCSFYNTTPPQTIYAADLERFTLMIDHAIYSTSLGVQTNAKNIVGRLEGLDGEEIELTPPNQIGQPGKLDIVELGVLLNASGTPTLDATDSDDPETAESFRYAGIILMVIIDYTNKISFNTSHFEYTISVRRVEETEFKAEELQFIEFPSSYEYWNRHGVRLIFLRLGTVGKFDFQTMLINIIAGSALLGATTYAVDFLAKYILPERQIYRAYMIQPTDDFSDLREDPEKLRLLLEGDPARYESVTANKVSP